jgi:hypothetical protein
MASKISRIKSKEGGTSEKNPPKPHYIAQQELRKKSMNARKCSMMDVSPHHYQTMNALSTSHIKSRGKRRE